MIYATEGTAGATGPVLYPVGDVGLWSTSELRSELRQTTCDLRAAESLEAAAARRYARERTQEAEVALGGRRERTAAARERHELLAREIASRGGGRSV